MEVPELDVVIFTVLGGKVKSPPPVKASSEDVYTFQKFVDLHIYIDMTL